MLDELMRGYKDRDIIEKICDDPRHRITLFDFLEHVAVGSLAYDLYCEYHDKGHARRSLDNDPAVKAEFIRIYRMEEVTAQDIAKHFGVPESAILSYARKLREQGVDIPSFKYHDDYSKNNDKGRNKNEKI